ncbi:Nuclear receptor [Caenorhabditis elegans]|uniref:Nuclear receptor n=1 Tax=Caenorhabditis elegans TaxID=6239 RepID=Q9N2W3_CAEEL|nr:Nuclear receptor [Caenorhabditis elegans]CCD74201.1 Nuclear receptor [Caenorhabditis elegans]|eukprot:NP_500250.2 Nuclear Hormone Receptor family [Caenorhabditis elegans]
MLTNMLLHADHHFYSSSQFASYYQYSQSSQFFEQMLRESSEIRAPSSGESRIPVVGRLKMPPPPPKLKHCEVCGNAGATSHYGGTVCGGCKIFFSRTVQSRKGFVCERGGQCPMNAGKRAKCRACRFQLCLKARMSPEEVGRLRDMRMGDYLPIVKKEGCVVGYFDESSQPSTSIEDCTSQVHSFIDTFKYKEDEMSVVNIFVNLERSCENNAALCYRDDFPKTFNASIDLQSAMEFPLPICERIPMDFLRKLFLRDPKENFKLFWCRSVLHFLQWCSAIEDLNYFSRQERTMLIAENFVSIGCLINFYGFLKIQREEFENCPEDGQIPAPCSAEWFQELSGLSFEAQTAVHRAISEIMEPMDSLDVSIEELVLMKFIMMFSEPSTQTSGDIYRIRSYRLKYCELLQKYIKTQIPDPERRIARIGELLKIVEAVKTTSQYFDKWMTMFFASNTCQMNDVLVYDFHVRMWSDVIPTSTSSSSSSIFATSSTLQKIKKEY